MSSIPIQINIDHKAQNAKRIKSATHSYPASMSVCQVTRKRQTLFHLKNRLDLNGIIEGNGHPDSAAGVATGVTKDL